MLNKEIKYDDDFDKTDYGKKLKSEYDKEIKR
jgi:hypothetical protein